jgi:hypothetical protein
MEPGMLLRKGMFVILGMLVAGCSSTGNLGLASKSIADPGSLITSGRAYKEIGPAKGQACRFILVGIIPWGDSTASTAINDALAQSGGDALLNVAVTSNLYSLIPIYNVLCWTCTNVEGISIKYEAPPSIK